MASSKSIGEAKLGRSLMLMMLMMLAMISHLMVGMVVPTQPSPDDDENHGEGTTAGMTESIEMPPPPIPSKESKSLPSSSSNPSAGGVLDPQLRETALQRIAALKTLRKITLSQMYVLSS